jgi:hypothetical protein
MIVTSILQIEITEAREWPRNMARVLFTLRIAEEERAALEDLSKIEGRPVNQLFNEAIKNVLICQGPKEVNLEANLTCLRAYRKRDPEFRQALNRFVESEGSLADPLEGEAVEGKLVNRRLETAGPAQSRIRELLGV